MNYLYTDIVIIGAGVAGTSTLHHLLPYTDPKNEEIIIIDAGSAPGYGFDYHHPTTGNQNLTNQQSNHINNTNGSDNIIVPRYSGTAVFIDATDDDKVNSQSTFDGTISNTLSSSSYTTSNSNNDESKIIKMMVQIFACSIDTFISHHGIDGAKTYLQCTKHGLQIQKSIAKTIMMTTKKNILHELGSLYFAYKEDVDALRKEHDQFVSLGMNLFDNNGIEWYEKCDVSDCQSVSDHHQHQEHENRMYNLSKDRYIVTDSKFHCAIYFPNDAIIDSSQYSKLLLQHAMSIRYPKQHNHVPVRSMMYTVVTYVQRFDKPISYNDIAALNRKNDTNYFESHHSNVNYTNRMYTAIIHCYNTKTNQYYYIYCRHVIVATGGISIPQGRCIEDLYGIIRPCYSYLAHVPMNKKMVYYMSNTNQTIHSRTETNSDSYYNRSPNFFTWNFTHDWCYTDVDHIRISGEDHYSARKDSQQETRCNNLARWAYEQYNNNHDNNHTITSHRNNRIKSGNDKHLSNDVTADIPQQCGIYTETPDSAPIVGCTMSDTNHTICYIVGCNAWGQTILSYASTLIPPILGYRPYTNEEQDAMNVLSIQRFTHTVVPLSCRAKL